MEEITVKKAYSVGIYARLSIDSHNEKNESIGTQIEIAKSYLERQPDMILFGCYSDLGKTGTNFERDGFSRLMEDVRSRKVNCIIVKDFSRFGRNYIETGNYIQKIFPFLGVRFISVTDDYDSLFAENDDLGINLKNLANEMYARDIALKVKSAKRVKRESGSYVGGVPPYGYRAEWVGAKRCLFPEASAAEVVRWIFSQYDEGRKLKEIVAVLYAQEIHRPTEYRLYHHLQRQPGEMLRQWPRSSIKKILTDVVYTGCVPMADVRENAPQQFKDGESEDWRIKENTHEAIVSKQQFCRIAGKLEEKAEKRKRQAAHKDRAYYANADFYNKPVKKDAFGRVLFCGCCGRKLGRREIVKRPGSGHETGSFVYFCRNSAQIDEFRCDTTDVSEMLLTELVKAALRQEAALNKLTPESFVRENMKCAMDREKQITKKSEAIQRKLKGAEWAGSEQYRQYREGAISREAFLVWREQNRKETEKAGEILRKADGRIGQLRAEAARQSDLLREMTDFSGDIKPDGELVSALIERINLYPDRKVEIIFRFASRIPTNMREAGGGSE